MKTFTLPGTIHVSRVACCDCDGRGLIKSSPDDPDGWRNTRCEWWKECVPCDGEGDVDLIENDDEYRERMHLEQWGRDLLLERERGWS
jgi:hypothetical protein